MVQNVAAVAAARIVETGRQFDQVLAEADAELTLQESRGPVERTAIEAKLQKMDARLPDTFGLRIYDREGMLQYAVSNLLMTEQVTIRDRPYFKRLKEDNAPRILVSGPMVGRSSGKWGLVFARRHNALDGSFAGLLLVAVPVEAMLRGLEGIDVGPKGALTVYNEEFATIARRPAIDPMGGSAVGHIKRTQTFLEALSNGQETAIFNARSQIDDVERLLAVRKAGPYPLYMCVALADDDYLAGWRSQFSVALIGTALLLVTMLLAYVLPGRRPDGQTVFDIADADADARGMGFAKAEDRFVQLFQFLPLGIARMDDQGGLMAANWALIHMLGHETVDGRNASDLLGPTYRKAFTGQMELLKLNRRLGPMAVECLHRDGFLLPCRFSALSIGEGATRSNWLIVERRSSENDEAGLLGTAAFDIAREAILITDPRAKVVMVNPAFTRITGYDASEILGATPRIIKSDRHDDEFYRVLWRDLLSKGKWQGRIWNRRKNGVAFLAAQTISAVRDDQGRVVRYVSVFSDVTEMHHKDELLRHQAYHDALTGLPNRLLLEDRLAHDIEISRRSGEQLAVLFIDLDHFKTINDTLGHDAGDLLLIEIGNRLQTCVRRSDSVARLGGDEFVAVISNFGAPTEVAEVAEKISARLALPMTIKGHQLAIGASIGIALFPQDGHDVATLRKNADIAMYRAKKDGRGQFHFFDVELDGLASERMSQEAALRLALERGEFTLLYQPKIEMTSGRIVGAEALLRWNRGGEGLQIPASFMPAAEESGLISAIGAWVADEACRQLADWRRRGLATGPISLNISARQFSDRGLAAQLVTLRQRHGLEPEDVELEIGETTLMNAWPGGTEQLARLKAAGIRICIDDFGSAATHLAALRQLSVTSLKIDGTIIRGIERDETNAGLLRALAGIARGLDLDFQAKSVETAEEEAGLLAAGCERAQGYFYARPMAAAELELWLASRSVSTHSDEDI